MDKLKLIEHLQDLGEAELKEGHGEQAAWLFCAGSILGAGLEISAMMMLEPLKTELERQQKAKDFGGFKKKPNDGVN